MSEDVTLESLAQGQQRILSALESLSTRCEALEARLNAIASRPAGEGEPSSGWQSFKQEKEREGRGEG